MSIEENDTEVSEKGACECSHISDSDRLLYLAKNLDNGNFLNDWRASLRVERKPKLDLIQVRGFIDPYVLAQRDGRNKALAAEERAGGFGDYVLREIEKDLMAVHHEELRRCRYGVLTWDSMGVCTFIASDVRNYSVLVPALNHYHTFGSVPVKLPNTPILDVSAPAG